MSNRRSNSNANRIRGPQSALTDFLASHNIDANQIRQSHEQRLQEAAQQSGRTEDAEGEGEADAADEEQGIADEEEKENAIAAKKRKRKGEKEEQTVQRIKKTKAAAKKRRGKGKPAASDDEDGDFAPYERFAKTRPGQLENCDICDKRFTVTGYSKEGPNGKLLCAKCSKEIEKEENKDKGKKKQGASRHRRRQMQSNLLDGEVVHGAKSLVQLCIQKVVANIHDIEDFGDLPPSLTKDLAKIFSKKRVVNSRTMDLFNRPDNNTVAVYDAAALSTDDFVRIFAVNPSVKDLYLENCGQFKDEVLDYVSNHPSIAIERLRLGGANLVEDEAWMKFIVAKGKHLKSLMLNHIDGHFGDDVFAEVVKHCPELERLKFEIMGQLSHKSIEAMQSLTQLTHLTLQTRRMVESESLVTLLSSKVGPQLRTLCLEAFVDVDDSLLASIHDNCRHLSKLRLSKNSVMTDAAFAALFTNWENSPLAHANLQRCRDVDASNATGNPEGLGLCGAGFEALMTHSGSRLEYLAITSNRHITYEAFFNVFDGVKQYPHLQHICVSFCAAVDDTILAGIFKSCPALKKIKVFACWNVADPVVPRGVVLLGKPNAQDDLAVEGDGRDFLP